MRLSDGQKLANFTKVAKEPEDEGEDTNTDVTTEIYYLNTQTGKFHTVTCRYAEGKNVVEYEGTLDDLLAEGKEPCGICLKDLQTGEE